MIRIIVCILSSAILYSSYLSSIFAQQVCDDAAMFRPLIGEWEGYLIAKSDRTHVGSLSTSMAVGGCALKQRFTAKEIDLADNFNYESLGFVGETGAWRETYVLSSGEVHHFRWEQNEEELILEHRSTSGSDRRRLVVFNIVEDSYQILEERSIDRGQTWTAHKLLQLVRKSLQAQPG